MLKKAIILSLALGMGVALAPIVSSADSKQPVVKAQTNLVDNTVIDPTNSNDNAASSGDSDDNSTMTNDTDSGSDDTLSSDATE